MRIKPHFNMWNYIFCARLRQGSGAEAVVLDGVDIFIRSGHGIDPYLHHPMFGHPDGRWKV
jgi:uncharacterized membrane protein